MTTETERALAWIIGHDTGASSKALWAVMMGQKSNGSHPHDGGDLGRCLRLLDLVPEWKPRLSEMAAVSPYWRALVDHWLELAALHAADDGVGLYKRMRAILDPITDADPMVFRMGKGVTVSFR